MKSEITTDLISIFNSDWKNITGGVLLLLTIVSYFIFPTLNTSTDGYSYAYSIKYGEELFYPHHLLYNWFYHELHKIMAAPFHIEALAFAKLLNATFATLILLLSYLLLREINPKPTTQNCFYILFTGCSYSILRFATENEVYILPVFLSLTGSFYFFRYLTTPARTTAFLAAFFLSASCLFHQIHFLWWLGILTGIVLCWKNIRQRKVLLTIYLAVATIVPVTYLLLLKFYYQQEITYDHVLHFIFSEFYTANVQTQDWGDAAKLTVINVGRSFYQVHGRLYYLIKTYPSILALVLFSLFFLLRSVLFFRSFSVNSIALPVKVTGLSVFILHLAFAFFSMGNAEFMVMLPVLAGLFLSYTNLPAVSLLYLSISMMFWNLSMAIIPDSRIDYNNTVALMDHATNNPGEIFFFKDALVLRNKYYYHHHHYPPNIIYLHPHDIATSDSILKSFLLMNKKIYSDIPGNHLPMSRSSVVEDQKLKKYFEQFFLTPADTIFCFTGDRIIFEVKNKKRVLQK